MPARLVGRYIALLGLSGSAGLAVGPAFGAALLSVSPAGLWLVAAILVTITGAAVLRLEGRIPEDERHLGAVEAALEPEAPPTA